MPFVLKKYATQKDKKIQIFLMQNLDLEPKTAQRLINRGRIFKEDMNSYMMSEIITEEHLYVAEFEGHTQGLKPLLTFEEFALFDKPTNLMVHPISKKTPYSLLDEVRFHFGQKANLIHRIDAETSGLVLVGRNLKSVKTLKTMFEEKKYNKSYLAIVQGEITQELHIDSSLEREGKRIGVRMKAGEEGKESLTIIKPIQYNKEKNLTLVEAIPITGRQHQIRVHLYSVGHRILGDPIYGVEDEYAEGYLNKTLSEEKRQEVTKSHRLWLHANYLEFTYKGAVYKIYSKNDDILHHFKTK
ncbi:RluA family pseudouridine synthase [Candidatus Marinarcus aquaticus]|uniref:RNA pseudouridylate synthase n=1 Tax=Candidatus Marinarcus aquaticus TaxID=2044504 RepID=A0A4Q0XV51_9BACT|nr:RNA pseudouridine synthase [Candidatus Marinarcus aquaticus]RXJ58053.1 RNA pseudouridine synthase [Candidatus Marinarcus aquaticus]